MRRQALACRIGAGLSTSESAWDAATEVTRKARVHARAEVDLAFLFLSPTHLDEGVIVAVWLSIAAIALIGIPAVVLLAAVPAWLAYQHKRGRLLRLTGQRKWHRWVLSGVAALAVEWLAFMLTGEADEWVWGLGGLLAVAVGVVMGVRDLRPHRGRVTPA